MSQQGLRQASVRAITGTAYDYNGDWHALFDLYGIPAGDYNGRLLAWINQVLGTSYTEINGAMQAFAEDQGAYNWSGLGEFSLFTYYVDSVGGNDANSGASPSQAFQNLSALPALAEGDSVGLAYGSSWLEQSIVSAADGVSVAAYGNAGAGLPLIDGNAAETYCIALTGDNVSVTNIRCARATDNNGCIYVPGIGTIDGCIAEEGTLHTLLLGEGTLRNSIIRNGSGASLVELFTGTDGATVTVENCQVYMDTYDSGMAGIDFHTSGGSVTYANVTVTGCTITNTGGGISGGDCDSRTFANNTTDGVLVAYGISGDAVITNPTDVNGVATGSFMSISAANATVVLDGGTVCREAFNTAMINCNQTGLNFTAKGNLKISAPTNSLFAIFFLDYGTVTIGEAGVPMEIGSPGGVPWVGILGRGSSVTLTTPGPVTFDGEGVILELNGVTKNSLTAIKADFTQFLQGTVGTVTACS